MSTRLCCLRISLASFALINSHRPKWSVTIDNLSRRSESIRRGVRTMHLWPSRTELHLRQISYPPSFLSSCVCISASGERSKENERHGEHWKLVITAHVICKEHSSVVQFGVQSRSRRACLGDTLPCLPEQFSFLLHSDLANTGTGYYMY